ncbi:hypothetical protein [Pseudomonas putida]|uniref:hypothetical protein n=1 Tax=Pseudomonas putida TaxID=303 RepID=UPI0024E0C267|nr:hypothetical protein [Pseudomonas putida]HDS0978131.1 hypothetical protein [Pseudomonas putida]
MRSPYNDEPCGAFPALAQCTSSLLRVSVTGVKSESHHEDSEGGAVNKRQVGLVSSLCLACRNSVSAWRSSFLTPAHIKPMSRFFREMPSTPPPSRLARFQQTTLLLEQFLARKESEAIDDGLI